MINQFCSVAVTLLASAACLAQTPKTLPPDEDPFHGRPLVFERIHADPAARLVPASPKGQGWTDGKVVSVSISPGLRVNLEAEIDTHHFPSHIHIRDAKSGATLKTLEVFDMQDAVWYFPGNGVAYVAQKELNLCGPRVLRKLEVKDGRLLETRQPVVWIGVDTKVLQAATLRESPQGGAIVATVPKDATVTVVGIQPGVAHLQPYALLVRSSLGLMGWLRAHEDGRLEISNCN